MSGPGEFNISDDSWAAGIWVDVCQRAISATLLQRNIAPERAYVSVLLTDDAEIARLNAEFRGKSTPTNVLSWPNDDLGAGAPGQEPYEPEPDPDGTFELGDLALAYETCHAEAEEQNKSLKDHVTHLVVHGVLHLLGYDHISDADAALMEQTERDILEKLGIADPYSVS